MQLGSATRRYSQPASAIAFARRRVGAGLVVARVVAVFAQLEAQLLAVRRVLQVFAEIADLALRLLVDADQAAPGCVIQLAAVLED